MNEKKYKVAMYLRLSQEDGDKKESDSIKNQRLLIFDYLQNKQNMEIVDEFVDDGYSGTNFERPEFIRMFNAMKKGTINCVIVKDLSRLGRNYIEMGQYLEQIFPEMGIRVIAINDYYDNEDGEYQNTDGILIPMKNLMNDAYCRDISDKIKSQLLAKKRRGDYIGNYAPYGYKKDPNNKSRIIIDDKVAINVRRIYFWKLSGESSASIAERLNQIGVLSPLEYRLKNGEKISDKKKKKETATWSCKMVTRILRNEVYTGVLVQGKNKKMNHRSKTIIEVPEEKWIKVEGTHDPIVSKDEFELVQILLNKNFRKSSDEDEYALFSGLLECGDCNSAMIRKSSQVKGKKYHYYVCRAYKQDKSCASHRISFSKVYDQVLDCINERVSLIEKLKDINDITDTTIENLEVKIGKLEIDLQKYKDKKQNLYNDYACEEISQEQYLSEIQVCKNKIADEQELLDVLRKRKKSLSLETEKSAWINIFLQYRKAKTITKYMLIMMVEKIYVYDNNKIEIVFRFENELQQLMENKQQEKELLIACV